MEEPLWLSSADVERLNRVIVEPTGEPFLVRDRSLLDGAVARPRNLWSYENVEDLAILAARLICGIGQNHPFEQGNKRTAVLAGLSFLNFNGAKPILPDTQAIAEVAEAAIIGEGSEEALANLLRVKPD